MIFQQEIKTYKSIDVQPMHSQYINFWLENVLFFFSNSAINQEKMVQFGFFLSDKSGITRKKHKYIDQSNDNVKSTVC